MHGGRRRLEKLVCTRSWAPFILDLRLTSIHGKVGEGDEGRSHEHDQLFVSPARKRPDEALRTTEHRRDGAGVKPGSR